ncbi:MAG: S41 family peptidase [Gammaproteobacteria bacterium]|nr:S41 family peptidase [Gammaproteobacteria bacterium]
MKLGQKLTIGAVGAVFGVLISITSGVFADKDEDSSNIPLEQLRTFSDVYVRIKQSYVDKVDDQELLENAIRGMLSGLDPHSSFMNQEEFKELREGTSGTFGGLGIEVTMEDGFVKVVSPIDDTPAQRAGMQPDDLITRIDDKAVKGMTLTDAIELMRGEPGTPIVLTVFREGEDKPLEVEIVREIIKVSSVKQRLVGDGIGYVRIANFTTSTVGSLAKGIEKLEEEYGDKLHGLVLDLRSNPGGVLSGAVGVSDAFLEDGMVVYTEGRAMIGPDKYYAERGDLLDGAPMVVLINSGSASASEIVAGALQDHGRAVIMGTTSFGKGSVQTIQDLANGDGLKLTTARYYTPSGRSIQAAGIVPDIELGQYELKKREESFKPVREGDLAGHLESDEEAAAKEKAEAEEAEEDPIGEDYWLFQAVNLLKGMYITHGR